MIGIYHGSSAGGSRKFPRIDKERTVQVVYMYLLGENMDKTVIQSRKRQKRNVEDKKESRGTIWSNREQTLQQVL